MASNSYVISASLYNNTNTTRISYLRSFTRPSYTSPHPLNKKKPCPYNSRKISAKYERNEGLQYRKVGDSDLEISEITLGTVSNCSVLMYI